MTKKVKTIIAIGFPILMFIISASICYLTSVNYEKSFVELNTLQNSKILLEKEHYNLYTLTAEGTQKKNLNIKVLKNKTEDTLNISISNKAENRFFFSSETIILNGKKYEYLSTVNTSKKGIFNITIDNPEKIKIRLVIQKQQDDSCFFKSILIYYLLSIFSIVLLLIVLIVIFVKSIRNKKEPLVR